MACSSISPSQTAKFLLSGDQWLEGEGKRESLDFLVRQLEDVLAGAPTSSLDPPEVDLICSHAIQVSQRHAISVSTAQRAAFRTLPRNGRYNPRASGILFRPASADILLKRNACSILTYPKIRTPRSSLCTTPPALILSSSGPCLPRNGKGTLSCMVSGWGRRMALWKKSSHFQRTPRSSAACTRRR